MKPKILELNKIFNSRDFTVTRGELRSLAFCVVFSGLNEFETKWQLDQSQIKSNTQANFVAPLTVAMLFSKKTAKMYRSFSFQWTKKGM